MQLVGGPSSLEGRVEVCRNGVWGTVCDYYHEWGVPEAQVVCQQLGYPYSGEPTHAYNVHAHALYRISTTPPPPLDILLTTSH